MALSVEEIQFFNEVAEELQEMDNKEDIIDRLKTAKEEYKRRYE